MTILTYKGYQGSIEVDIEENCLYGKVLHISDLITFKANTPGELETEFKSSVDDYILFCEENGISPEKAFKGSLNIRIGEELHRNLSILATQKNYSINELIKETLLNSLDKDQKLVQKTVLQTLHSIQFNTLSSYSEANYENYTQWPTNPKQQKNLLQ